MINKEKTSGARGDLTAGEAYIAPIKRTAHGVLIVEAICNPSLSGDVILTFESSEVVKLGGGGEAGNELKELLNTSSDDFRYRSRRSFTELGVWTNPNTKRFDSASEAEKIKGTVHIAIGNNSHIGGLTTSDLHLDFTIPG